MIRNSIGARLAAGKNLAPVFFQPGKKIRPVNQAVFRDLRIAGAEFAWWERVEHAGVGQHQPGLMEDADQVLAMA